MHLIIYQIQWNTRLANWIIDWQKMPNKVYGVRKYEEEKLDKI